MTARFVLLPDGTWGDPGCADCGHHVAHHKPDSTHPDIR